VAYSLLKITGEVYENYHQPREWDFLGFWLNGKVASAGENFYHPENYQNVVLPYNLNDEFRAEIIEVGFWYPPFTMFLFFPLGLANPSNAFLKRQIVNLIICINQWC
jgi:hypothetical protein